MKKDLLYALCCLSFAIVIGGAVYEHLSVVPRWAAAPPVSLTMFQGPYGLNAALFWKNIHPVNLLLFTATLILHWRSERRRPLLVVVASYMAILVVTAIYFVPELLRITSAPYAPTPDPELTKSALLWERLSLVRLGMLVVLSLVLFLGLTKGGQRQVPAHSQSKIREALPA